VGDPGDERARALLSVVRSAYRPFQVVAFGAPSTSAAQVPLLRERAPSDDRAAAYVCSGSVCQMPARQPEELLNLLRGTRTWGARPKSLTD